MGLLLAILLTGAPWYPGGTNLVPWSEQLELHDNESGGRYPITANVTIPLAPNGTQTADSINFSVNQGYFALQALGATVTSNTVYTQSVWARCNLSSCTMKWIHTDCSTHIGAIVSDVPINNTAWTLVSLTTTSLPTETCWQIAYIRWPGNSSTLATYYLSEFQLDKGPRRLPYHPTGASSVSWSPRFRHD